MIYCTVLGNYVLVRYHLLLLLDVDECSGRNGRRLCPLRNSVCVNKLGGHACECRKGFKQLQDGTCEGIGISHRMVQLQMLATFVVQQTLMNVKIMYVSRNVPTTKVVIDADVLEDTS